MTLSAPFARRGTRLLLVCLLGFLWMGLMEKPASAISYPNEQALVDLPQGEPRDTFIITGTPHQYLSRSDLINHAGYYNARGFDMNFLTWAPTDANFEPGAREWAWCSHRPVGSFGICNGTVEFAPIRSLVLNGPVRVLDHGGALIGLACGNHSRSGAAGPVPHITGAKYEDLNGDGDRNLGEPGLPNWTIHLRYNGQTVATTQTGGDGTYNFALDANGSGPGRFGAGSYSLVEDQQSGWAASEAPADVFVDFGVGGATYDQKDFGNYRPAGIAGRKVEDMDADGVNGDDPGLSGWGITLTGIGRPGAQTTTSADGAYVFGGLRPGTYSVSEVQQAGWTQSAPAGGSYTRTVSSGETVSGLDFGNYRFASISGRKFNDRSVDGTGTGDPGLPDWTINRSGGASRVTGADGSYRFDELVPGTYRLEELIKTGWRQTTPSTGSHEVRVRSGDDRTGVEFGNVCLGSIGIGVDDITGHESGLGLELRLDEVNVPGVLDNEPPLPRLGIDRDSFDGLLPGTYRLTAFLPDGVFSADPDARIVEGRWAIVKEVVVVNCTETRIDLEVFTSSVGKVTGGVRLLVPGGFATSGFEFQAKDGSPTGMLEFQDHVEGLNLHTRIIEGILVDESRTNAWIWGRLTLEGETVRFRLHLIDAGEPGTNDRFHLSMPGYEAGLNVTLIKGNVQIHKS
jgi:hypothetical protein